MKLRTLVRLGLILLALSTSVLAQSPATDPGATPPPNPFSDAAESTPVENPFLEPEKTAAPAATPAATTAAAEPAPTTTGAVAETTPTFSRRSLVPHGDSGEIRGVYVLSSVGGFQSSEQVAALAADVRAANFNRVYPEIRTSRGLAVSSDTETVLPFISPAFPNPAAQLKDQLAGAAKVFPVLSVLPAYSAITGTKPLAGNILTKFPAFRNQTDTGEFVAPDNDVCLDPGNPAVQEYLATILLEIDTKILPEGYLFTGFGYPGKNWGYSPRAVAEFRSIVGGSGPPPPDDPTWCAYRRDQLTKLMAKLKGVVVKDRPGVKFSVLIKTSGPPPLNWDEWIASPTYANQMQDWIGWCRDGIVDEIVLEVHERLAPQGNNLEEWINFVNSNCAPARPVISLAGGLNFNESLTTQMGMVRGRGVGTLLHHYAAPTRSTSRGFFASLPDIVFNVPPGKPLPPKAIMGTTEFRTFARMPNPPAAMATKTPEAVAFINPLQDKPLVFNTPSPIPTPSPLPKFVPEAITRKVTLVSGVVVEAVVLEVTPESLTIQQAGSVPMEFPRSRIARVEPPL